MMSMFFISPLLLVSNLFYYSSLPPFLSSNACLIISKKVFLHQCSFFHSDYHLKITFIIVDKNQVNIKNI